MRVDRADTKNNGATNSTTLTLSFPNAGSYLLVTVPESRSATVSSVTFNGVSFGSQLAGTTNGNSSARIFGLVNPFIGTADIVVTYGTSQTGYIIGAISFFGAATAAPIGNTNTKTGTAQNKSIVLDTGTYGSFVVDCIGALGGVHTPHASQTSLVANNNRISSYKAIGAAGTGAGDTSWTATASDVYSYAAVEVRADRGAARRYWQGMDFSNFSKGVF